MKQGSASRVVVAGLMIAVLLLVVFFMVGKPLADAYRQSALTAMIRRAFLPVGKAQVRGAPLPAGPDAPLDKAFKKQYVAWLDRTIMAHFPADKDPKGAAFMRAALDFYSTNSDTPSAELLAEEQSFPIDKVNDAGLLYMIGVVEPLSDRDRAAFAKATSLMPASAYPKFIWYLAAANAGKTAAESDAAPGELKQRDALSLEYLKEGLNDGSFLPSEMPVLRWRLDAGSVSDLSSRNRAAVAAVVRNSKDTAPWLKDYFEGVYYKDAAWDARGDDYASAVTQQGWKGFREDLALARAYLVQSWHENPRDPAAACRMIAVCMGENERIEPMRTWFDRSVAVDFDYTPAYSAFEWGLRPRWLGSHADMREFADECIATGRYDTQVPIQEMYIELQISDDTGDRGNHFRDAQISGKVLGVIDTYFTQPNPPIEIAYCRTAAAIVAQKAGRLDEVKKHLAALDYQPSTNSFLAQLTDMAALVREARGK